MTNFVHNLDLDLPVFSRWTRVAWSTSDIQSRANSHAEKFVRRVTLQYTGATSLKGALRAADTALDRVAEFAGIEVVEHTWGLTKRTPSRGARRYDHWRLSSDFVPKGYQLVAEVANVSPLVNPPEELYDSVRRKLITFNTDSSIPGPKIHEIHTGAVGFHEVQEEGPKRVQGVILDIDPYLRPNDR